MDALDFAIELLPVFGIETSKHRECFAADGPPIGRSDCIIREHTFQSLDQCWRDATARVFLPLTYAAKCKNGPKSNPGVWLIQDRDQHRNRR